MTTIGLLHGEAGLLEIRQPPEKLESSPKHTGKHHTLLISTLWHDWLGTLPARSLERTIPMGAQEIAMNSQALELENASRQTTRVLLR